MKLAVMNCDVFFTVNGRNIVSVEIIKAGDKPYKINLRQYGRTGNTIR